MLLSLCVRRSLCLGSLLLVLASCGNTSRPVADAPTPRAGETDTTPDATVPPGEVDRADAADKDEKTDDSTPAAPNSPVPVSDGVRVLSCQTSGGIVDDPNGPLNVRSEPDASADNVVGTIPDGAPVSIVGDRDNWWQLDAPEVGWVSKNLVASHCNEKVARIELPPNATSVIVTDRIVGTGYHHYELEASAGQRLTIDAIGESPLPLVLDIEERDLTDGAADKGASQWSGELPEDGNYTLVFDSNFRGYTYEIGVEIR